MKFIIIERETDVNEFGEYVEDFYTLGVFNTANEADDALHRYVRELAKDSSKKFDEGMMAYRDKMYHEFDIQIADEGKIERREVKF